MAKKTEKYNLRFFFRTYSPNN